MNRREVAISLLLLVLGVVPCLSVAQQPGKVWRVGMLETMSMAANAANLNAFLKGMQELGYVEGQNLVLDYRSADGRGDRFPNLATSWSAPTSDFIVTRGTPATQAARAATAQIPIVTAASSDIVRTGLAKSFRRPEGNVTGLDPLAIDLLSKRVQLIREVFPKATRILAVMNVANAAIAQSWEETERAAGTEFPDHAVRRASGRGLRARVQGRRKAACQRAPHRTGQAHAGERETYR